MYFGLCERLGFSIREVRSETLALPEIDSSEENGHPINNYISGYLILILKSAQKQSTKAMRIYTVDKINPV